MRARTRRRRVRRQQQLGLSAPLDLTHEEVLADLDAGWVDWMPETTKPDLSSRAA